ncbi:MAG TPA: helix-turn-helix domain-containing protein, partial [Ignavibacteriales bacterium]|nr:helix-turn-helix domain-containing protein [Ignavibacteriales bacterium]
MNAAKAKEKKIIVKAKIIEAASGFFSAHNYHEVMMEDIAKAAGIAKGTLYNYFESKESLYFTIMLDRMETLIASL